MIFTTIRPHVIGLQILLSFFAQAQLTIRGKISPSENWENKLYIARIDKIGLSTPVLIDSVLLKDDGSFTYTFDSDPQGILYQISQPCSGCNYVKTISGPNENSFLLVSRYNTRDQLLLQGSSDQLYSGITMTGSDLNTKMAGLRNLKQPISQLLSETAQLKNESPEKVQEKKVEIFRQVLAEAELLKTKLHAILDTCQTPALIAGAIFYLNEAYLGQLQVGHIQQYTSRLPDSEVLLYQNLKKNNLANPVSKIGLALPDTKFIDAKGKQHFLHEIKGKYKVIDFWASWCGPCRKANIQQLPVLHAKLSKHHIPIIGISIDKDVNLWKEALKKDKTPWLQVMEVGHVLGSLIKPEMEGVPLYLVINENNMVVLEARSPAQVEIFFKQQIEGY